MRDNGPAIRKVCQQFVALCRDINLLDSKLVAIDGSRFKAMNAKAKNYTRGKLRQKLSEIDAAIERYLGEIDRADEVFEQTGGVMPASRMERALRKVEHLKKEAARYRSIEERMVETGETLVSLSDPDARSMATTPRMPRVVGYNVQTAVDAENHLIVAHEVTMHGYDRDALSMMAIAARDAMGNAKPLQTRVTSRAKKSWLAKRRVSQSLFRSRKHRMHEHAVSSTRQTLPMTPKPIPTFAQLVRA